MALRHIDGFDAISSTTHLLQKYSSSSGTLAVNTSGGRTGGYVTMGGASAIGVLRKTLDSQSLWVAGFAFRVGTVVNKMLIGFGNSSNGYAGLRLMSTGRLKFHTSASSGFTDIADGGWGGPTLVANTWYYVEVRFPISSSVGANTLLCYLDGSLVLTANSGANTTVTGGAPGFVLGSANSGSANGTIDYDDFYVCDGTGSVNNNAPLSPDSGGMKVETLLPSGAGASSSWTPNSGSNYARVNESVQDGDTTYNSTSTVSNRDSYALADLSSSPVSIAGVQVTGIQRVDASESTRQTSMNLRISGTNYDGSNQPTLTSSYAAYSQIWDQDPNAVGAWTRTVIDSMEAGIRLVN